MIFKRTYKEIYQNMDNIVIRKKIYLASQFLTRDYRRHLVSTLTEELTGKCQREYGHIISVDELVSIKDHQIGNTNSESYFIVDVSLTVLNPSVDAVLEGEVCMVYADGIFVNVMDTQKLLIPATSLDGWVFHEQENCYKLETPSTTTGEIRKGDTVTVQVTAAQYSEGCFSCLGVLKDVTTP